MNNQPSNSSDNRIDLFDFFSSLWKEKITITLITFLFMTISVIYVLSTTEKWSVSATIDTPTTQQTKQYNLNRELFNRGIKSLNKGQEYEGLPSIKSLHNLYVSEALKTENQITFFKSQQLFKTMVTKDNLNLIAQNNYAHKWAAKNISITAKHALNSNNIIGTNIRISATNPNDALEFNKAYLNFINDIMIERLRDLISDELSLSLKQIVDFNEKTKIHEKFILEKQINDIEKNIKIAKIAKIKNFVTQNISLESAPEYTKGYEILSAEKSILTEMLNNYEQNKVINSSALLIAKWHDYDKKMQFDKFDFYQLTDKPHLPKTKDHPKRSITLILGTLLGLIFGVAYVLVINALRSTRRV
ncbi:Wzz/FepE/Etk N-terminal domain-containing protein [Moritella sp. Urea-trap-13]|uniref:Wzz/FepE/Etk N-terminal domain-containing protein n=1 Tax=Moritella sp. Urea-trap-13 TaxID=2058327 RepID=UPI000C34290D|nr:Wzz/FepE/Etk N-terminal domain-containing protein [Moritella sp. Urea-trap-13]PKH05311.1 hypothetical protein CXF93_18670 [Moritella sp. Urea-trap-13]